MKIKSENTAKRNHEIVCHAKRISRKAAEEGRLLSLDALIAELMHVRPSSFYVDYDRAMRVLNMIERKGIEALSDRNQTRDKWQDLHTQVVQMMKVRTRLDFGQAVTQVITFGRPMRFYLGRDAIRKIIAPYIDYSVNVSSLKSRI